MIFLCKLKLVYKTYSPKYFKILLFNSEELAYIRSDHGGISKHSINNRLTKCRTRTQCANNRLILNQNYYKKCTFLRLYSICLFTLLAASVGKTTSTEPDKQTYQLVPISLCRNTRKYFLMKLENQKNKNLNLFNTCYAFV